METQPLVPAAQYLRVSTERQEYSLDFQGAGIAVTPSTTAFVIVLRNAYAWKPGECENARPQAPRRAGLDVLRPPGCVIYLQF